MGKTFLAIVVSVLYLGCDDTDPGSPPVDIPSADAEVMEHDGAMAPDGADSPPMDSGVPPAEDAAPSEDAEPPEDASPPGDATLPDEVPPTWVDCHLAAREGELDDAFAEQCDTLHTTPPAARLYGIRFVLMGEVGDVMDFVEPRLEAANQIFEPAGMQFTIASIVNVEDDEVQYLTGDQPLSLGARLGGLRAHLELPEADLDTLLDTLRTRLRSSGADPAVVDALSGESVFTDQLFMRLMARVHPEDIYLAVGDVAERMGAGGQAPPPFHPIHTLERSVVSIRPGTKTTVPAHELGHYFGLKHPHAGSARGPNFHLFDINRTENTFETRAGDEYALMDVLGAHFGEGFSDPLGEPFLAYDVDADDIPAFEALRFALMNTWARWRMASPSWLATHPPTPIISPGRDSFHSRQRPSCEKTFSWAF